MSAPEDPFTLTLPSDGSPIRYVMTKGGWTPYPGEKLITDMRAGDEDQDEEFGFYADPDHPPSVARAPPKWRRRMPAVTIPPDVLKTIIQAQHDAEKLLPSLIRAQKYNMSLAEANWEAEKAMGEIPHTPTKNTLAIEFKCSCGSDTAGVPFHSSWCDKYEKNM